MRCSTLVLCLLVACGDDSSPDSGVNDAGSDARGVDSSAADAGPGDAGPGDAGPSDDAEPDSGPGDAGASSCEDDTQNGDETDIDCGGLCDACSNGGMCLGDGDCFSDRCDETCLSPEGTHPDIVRVADVAGRNPGGRSWADSYSVGDECYCETTFDHNIADIMVDTPAGPRTVREVCEAIGDGPGSDDRPLYNDIQCGNGPANDAGDEDDCPGRVDIGRDGCGHIGPRWNLSAFE